VPELLEHPEWTGGHRGRVLVEAAEWGVREAITAVLRGAGYATVACAGPEGTGQRCALATAVGCQASAQADVVVHALRSTDARNLEALRALRRLRPDTPVVVEASPAVAAKRTEDFAGCFVIDSPFVPQDLLDAVDAALASAAERS